MIKLFNYLINFCEENIVRNIMLIVKKKERKGINIINIYIKEVEKE